MKLDTLLGALFILWLLTAWLVHIIVCIKSATWGLLVAGAIFVPIGVIHGTGYLLGFFN